MIKEPTHLIAPVLAITSLVAISVPGWSRFATVFCLVGWVALGAVCGAGLVQKIRRERDGIDDPRPRWMFLVMPVFLALVVLSAIADLPLRARFELSQDELTGTATAVLEAKGTPVTDRIGSFRVESVQADGRSVWFVTSGLGTDDKWGFVYSPGGQPASADRYLEQLDDSWWLWGPTRLGILS